MIRPNFLCIFVLKITSGPRMKICRQCFTPPVVYATDRSKTVVQDLFLLSVVLWFLLGGVSYWVLPCSLFSYC